MVDCYVGEIRIMAGPAIPAGWHDCDGSLLSIQNYPLLYAVMGTVYGGNGTTEFALPDLRGRLMISQGLGPGLTQRNLGASGGAETVALLESQLPAHTHQFNTAGVAGTVSTPSARVTLANTTEPMVQYLNTGIAGTEVSLSGHSITNAGASVPHMNMMPTVALRFMIATEGLYPSN